MAKSKRTKYCTENAVKGNEFGGKDSWTGCIPTLVPHVNNNFLILPICSSVIVQLFLKVEILPQHLH